jgi:hypothetical protein
MRRKNLKKQLESVQLGIQIEVDMVAMQKLWLWTDMAQGEVSALGLVDEIMDEDIGRIVSLRVIDFLLVNQICSECETELDPASIALLLQEMEAKEKPSKKLRCWVHSHGTMGVFWSGTDNDCIEGLANGEYLLSLVVNKKHHALMRLDQFHPAHLYVTDVVWEVFYATVTGLEDECRKEFKSKVVEGYTAVKIPLVEYKADLPHYLPVDYNEIDLWEGVDEEIRPF